MTHLDAFTHFVSCVDKVQNRLLNRVDEVLTVGYDLEYLLRFYLTLLLFGWGFSPPLSSVKSALRPSKRPTIILHFIQYDLKLKIFFIVFHSVLVIKKMTL